MNKVKTNTISDVFETKICVLKIQNHANYAFYHEMTLQTLKKDKAILPRTLLLLLLQKKLIVSLGMQRSDKNKRNSTRRTT